MVLAFANPDGTFKKIPQIRDVIIERTMWISVLVLL
jgi:hypothetical protein